MSQASAGDTHRQHSGASQQARVCKHPQTHRQPASQAGRQTDRQRRTHTHTNRHTHPHQRHTVNPECGLPSRHVFKPAKRTSSSPSRLKPGKHKSYCPPLVCAAPLLPADICRTRLCKFVCWRCCSNSTRPRKWRLQSCTGPRFVATPPSVRSPACEVESGLCAINSAL